MGYAVLCGQDVEGPDHGHQRGGSLHHGVLLADAVSRTSQEGEVAVGVAALRPLRQEAVWVKGQRVWPVLGVAQWCEDVEEQVSASRNLVAEQLHVLRDVTTHNGDGWEEAKSLQDESLRELESENKARLHVPVQSGQWSAHEELDIALADDAGGCTNGKTLALGGPLW